MPANGAPFVTTTFLPRKRQLFAKNLASVELWRLLTSPNMAEVSVTSFLGRFEFDERIPVR